MTAVLWFIAGFGLGWLVCWKTSYWLLRRLGRPSDLTTDVLKSLSPDSFKALHERVLFENERRKAL